MFEKRMYRDVNGLYRVQVRQLPLNEWEPNDGWRTVFIAGIEERARENLEFEPGVEVEHCT